MQAATIKNTLDVFDRTFAATLAYPSDQDVTLSVTVDPSLVERYNVRYGTSWPMLDAKYYTLSAETATIAAGKTTSETLTLHLQNLLGEGADQTGALPLDETYLVPVTISQSSVPTLGLLVDGLVRRQALVEHHHRGATRLRELDQLPDARQVRRQQQGLERPHGHDL